MTRLLILSANLSHAIKFRHELEKEHVHVAVRLIGAGPWNVERFAAVHDLVIVDMTPDRDDIEWSILERLCRTNRLGGGGLGVLGVSIRRGHPRCQIKAERLGARWVML